MNESAKERDTDDRSVLKLVPKLPDEIADRLYLHLMDQACGLVDINVIELGVDFLSISAHKINGPKGVGLLYAKEGLKLQPALCRR